MHSRIYISRQKEKHVTKIFFNFGDFINHIYKGKNFLLISKVLIAREKKHIQNIQLKDRKFTQGFPSKDKVTREEFITRFSFYDLNTNISKIQQKERNFAQCYPYKDFQKIRNLTQGFPYVSTFMREVSWKIQE